MLDSGLETTQSDDLPPAAGVILLLVHGMAVGVFIDCHCIADGVEPMR